jgi:hypothetical protein
MFDLEFKRDDATDTSQENKNRHAAFPELTKRYCNNASVTPLFSV